MAKKIGILTSGGDCQGLNSAIRGVAKSLYTALGNKVEIYGFLNGFAGLMTEKYRKMEEEDFSGILKRGGTILGTSRQPFKQMKKIMNPELPESLSKEDAMVATYQNMKLDALVILGGNGTHKTANMLAQRGLNIVSLPKTIDNDLWGTDITFGFQSAVNVATEVIDAIHTTAASHGRVFIIELMGHKAGWLTLSAGMASGADIILVPEIPYDVNEVINLLKKREAKGKPFSIIAIAEGAITKTEALMSKKQYLEHKQVLNRPSVAYELEVELNSKMVQEIRCTVPGHFQRGGDPCAFDRILTTKLGAAAGRLILEKKFGYMVGFVNNEVVPVPLSEVAGKLKLITEECELVKAARATGVCFGDGY